jgi:undecaprenyl-diphosphatase
MNKRSLVIEDIHNWDVLAFRRFNASPRRSHYLGLAKAISHTGNGYLYPLIPMVVAAVGVQDSHIFLQLTVTAFTIERLVYFFAKKSFKRKRPANVLPNYNSAIVASDEFSFPSGHSSAAFLMVTLLVISFGAAFAVLYLWSAMVACSRVLLGVHFPTDIMVGSLMGCAIAFLASLV